MNVAGHQAPLSFLYICQDSWDHQEAKKPLIPRAKHSQYASWDFTLLEPRRNGSLGETDTNFKVTKRSKVCSNHFWVIRYRCDTCWKPTLYTLWKVIQTRASMWKEGLRRKLEPSSSSKGNISEIQSQMLSLQGSNLGISIQRKSLHESALSLHQSVVSSPSDIKQVTGCQTSDIYYRILHSLNAQFVLRIAITTQVCRDQSLLCCLTWSMKRWRL